MRFLSCCTYPAPYKVGGTEVPAKAIIEQMRRKGAISVNK
jgi:hypothetical protein